MVEVVHCISFALCFCVPHTICISQSHYSHSEEYHTESSRGSDLSDIMEEDEEELYSEMQHEEGRRRNSHNALKVLQKMKRIIKYPQNILVCMTVTSFLFFPIQDWRQHSIFRSAGSGFIPEGTSSRSSTSTPTPHGPIHWSVLS